MDREKLMKIIRKDAYFFRDHDIIDYSLLVGVIHNQNQSMIEDNKNSKNLECDDLRETLIYEGKD